MDEQSIEKLRGELADAAKRMAELKKSEKDVVRRARKEALESSLQSMVRLRGSPTVNVHFNSQEHATMRLCHRRIGELLKRRCFILIFVPSAGRGKSTRRQQAGPGLRICLERCSAVFKATSPMFLRKLGQMEREGK